MSKAKAETLDTACPVSGQPKKEFKSELEYLRHFKDTAENAAWGMVEASYCLSLALKVLGPMTDQPELSDTDTRCLFGLLELFKKTIADLQKQEERITDHDILYGFPPRGRRVTP